MKLIDLRDKVKAGFHPVVRFRKDIAALETYFEEYMFARLVRIDKEYDDHCGFVFDCTEFDEHNAVLKRLIIMMNMAMPALLHVRPINTIPLKNCI